MKCTDCEEKLSDYIEHALGSADQTLVERHLNSCRSCSELIAGMSDVMEASSHFAVHTPPPWLATRIVANTPRVRRKSLRSLLSASWQSLGDSRTALAIFTAAVVMGWIGGAPVRETIYDRAESVMSCAYDRAVRSYYRSPVVIEIHSRLGQLMENS